MLNDIYTGITERTALQYFYFLVFFCFLTVTSVVLTALCRKYVRVMDYASERSSHTGAIPRSGGLAIAAVFCIGILIYYLLRGEYFVNNSCFWGLFLSALGVAVVSFYDDVTDNTFLFKLLSQLVGVAILIAFGLTIKQVTIPFYGKATLGAFSYPLTLLWIVGITNAVNFMDGLNGLVAGVVIIVSFVFMFINILAGVGFTYHVSYIIAAACMGFMFFNFPRASIFMGDVGSSFLGFCLGAVAILAANFDLSHVPFMVMPILLSNFVLETFMTFVWRLLRREKVWRAHKMHPYQLLNRMGVSSRTVVLIYFMQSVVLSILCVVYLYTTSLSYKIIILASVVSTYMVYFFIVHYYARRRMIITIKYAQLSKPAVI